MRISSVHNALIFAAAGPLLAFAAMGAPAYAQMVAASGPGPAPAAAAPAFAKGPIPPADIPSSPPSAANTPPADTAAASANDGDDVGSPVQLTDVPPQTPPAASTDAASAYEEDTATPVAPDAPVASKNLPAPGAAPSTAADAALTMANMMDGAGGGVSNADLMSSLENAAAAGQPMALWRLGTMYENGEGVAKDDVKAFDYFSQIANDHADAAPKGVDSDIVAQSFVKMGDYYREGLPDAGIPADPERAEQLVLHAATYFGNADAQYRIGEMYLTAAADPNPLQGARWLSLAAHKGHVAAQAKLGDLLFNGAGIKSQPAEGLMWLSIAHDRSIGTPDEGWINDLLSHDMLSATPEQREAAIKMANAVEPQFGPPDDSTPDD
jgi:TPR repeat protein